jgi:hypothetical protein
MVDEARHRYPRREFVCQDVANLGRTAQWAVLAGVLNSVPDPAQLLVDSWRQCRAGLIADVIRDGALPGSFTDLNRFQLMEVAEYLRSLGAHRVEAAVHAKYWSIVIAWKAQC